MMGKRSTVILAVLALNFVPAYCRAGAHEFEDVPPVGEDTLGRAETVLVRRGVMPPGVDEREVEVVANSSVSVRVKDGGVYSNARVEVNWDYKVLIIHSGRRAPKNLPFDEVEAIIDAEGRDITEEILREYAPSNRQPERVVGGDSVNVESDRGAGASSPYGYRARVLPWKFGLSVSPTYPFPFGTWFEGLEPAVGARFVASIGLTREVALEIGYQYQPLGVSEEDLSAILGELGVSGGSEDFDFRVDKVFVGPRYLSRVSAAPLWGYGSFGVGAYRHIVGVKIESMDLDESVSETKFGMTYSGGLVYMFSPNVGMDVGGRLDWVLGAFDTSGFSTGISNGYFAEFSVGVVLAI